MAQWQRVGDGLYRHGPSGSLYERPKVGGRWTFRKLKARTIKLAKEEMALRRAKAVKAAIGLGPDPYGPPACSVGELFAAYKQDGCPRLDGSARSGSTLEKELYRLKKLEPFWKDRPGDAIRAVHLADYHSWRKKDLRQGSHGGRSVDREISTLSNVLLKPAERPFVAVDRDSSRNRNGCPVGWEI